jgi:hypothetical protein
MLASTTILIHMIVDVNTDFLINNKVTANQFLLLSLLLADKQSILRDYFLTNNISVDQINADITKLQEMGFLEGNVTGLYDLSRVRPTFKWKTLFTADDLFKEFLITFPLKVTRTDGTTDYLRTDQSKARMLYLANTRGKKSIHDHIIKCLKHEVKYREANGAMKFMKRMTSWLTSQEWEAFEDQIDDLGNITFKDNDTGYGTELI